MRILWMMRAAVNSGRHGLNKLAWPWTEMVKSRNLNELDNFSWLVNSMLRGVAVPP